VVGSRRTVVGVLVGAVLATSALLATPAARAQDRLPPGVRGPATGTATRSVTKYLALERALEQSLAERDRAAATHVLADDFEVRSPSSPDATAANDWIAAELADARQARRVDDLAVREFDDIAVVSFSLVPSMPAATKRRTPTFLVVDVWRRSSDQLQVRYIEISANSRPRPGRPSGRE
jgi:hypothetical protein